MIKLLSTAFFFGMGIFSFFTGKTQKSGEQPAYEKLTAPLKETYRVALQKNPQLPFGDEFRRTTDLQYELISRYGFDGIRFVFEENNGAQFYELGKFPPDCPWYSLNGQNIAGFISQNFSPIRSKIPDLVKALTERSWFIYAEKMADGWQLHYLLKIKLFDDRNYFRIYSGGAPNKNPLPNDNLRKYHWDIPAELKTLYSIHDGFGEINDAIAILSSTEIRVMAEMMNPICAAENSFPEGYKFEDLLEFFPDGAGNSQCFYRDGNSLTVDWDHETWELGGKMGFFDFINERMAVLDEE